MGRGRRGQWRRATRTAAAGAAACRGRRAEHPACHPRWPPPCGQHRHSPVGGGSSPHRWQQPAGSGSCQSGGTRRRQGPKTLLDHTAWERPAVAPESSGAPTARAGSGKPADKGRSRPSPGAMLPPPTASGAARGLKPISARRDRNAKRKSHRAHRAQATLTRPRPPAGQQVPRGGACGTFWRFAAARETELGASAQGELLNPQGDAFWPAACSAPSWSRGWLTLMHVQPGGACAGAIGVVRGWMQVPQRCSQPVTAPGRLGGTRPAAAGGNNCSHTCAPGALACSRAPRQ